MQCYQTLYSTPVGMLRLVANDDYLLLCDWPAAKHASSHIEKLSTYLPNFSGITECENPLLRQAMQSLAAYFDGSREDLNPPIVIFGTTFQCQVWSLLTQIPYSKTMSYKDLAIMLGKPKAVRAVANAVASNPLSIFIPCHRVIGSNGQLSGYEGGVRAKRFLLNLEQE